jgi:putative endonuclease
MKNAKNTWSVYILECSDGSMYTGITNDIDRRLNAHREGTASKYTRSRLPVKIVFSVKAGSKSRALKTEHRVKELSRSEKLELIKGLGRNKQKARQ